MSEQTPRSALSKALIEGSWKLIWAEDYDPADNLLEIIAGLPATDRLAIAGITEERLAGALGRPDDHYEGHMVVWKQGVGFLNDPAEGARAILAALEGAP